MKAHLRSLSTRQTIVYGAVLGLLSSAAQAGQVIYVNAGAAGAGNGTSWVNAYTSLQSAIAVAQPGDSIWVAKGVYKPSPAGQPEISFVLGDGLSVYGGFVGNEASSDQRDCENNFTILNGDIDSDDPLTQYGASNGVSGKNSYHIIQVATPGAKVHLDCLMINGGNAYAPGANDWIPKVPDGGGILNIGGELSLDRVIVAVNNARNGGGIYSTGNIKVSGGYFILNISIGDYGGGNGGGIALESAKATIEGSKFTYNKAWMSGGGIDCHQASINITDSIYEKHEAWNGAGGAIRADDCEVNLGSSTFTNNASYGGALFNHGGGALAAAGGNLVMDGLRFVSNSAKGDGGAVLRRHGITAITKSVFYGNETTAEGGALSLRGDGEGKAEILNSEFRGNHAYSGGCFNCNDLSGGGGAIHNWGWMTTAITNTLFSGNAATNGGAIYDLASARSMTIKNSTFSGNYAYFQDNEKPDKTGRGGAIFSNVENKLYVDNSLAWNNRDRNGVDTERASLFITQDGFSVFGETIIRYSMLQGCNPNGVWDPYCGTDGGGNAIDTDPKFIADVPVWAPNAMQGSLAGDAHLGFGSPFINAGSDALVPMGITDDLDGFPRVSGKAVDMGSYEAALCSSKRVYVTVMGAGKKDGTSWANAAAGLQYPLSINSASKCEVWVASGEYTPSASGDRQASFQLKNNLALYGGFVGTETQLNQRDWKQNVTVLSGDLGITKDDSDNSWHVVRATGVNATALLDGFSVRAGHANGQESPDDFNGGGLLLNKASPTLRNLTIEQNIAAGFGGGIYKTGSGQPVMESLVFRNNSAGKRGGGLHSDNGALLLNGALFDGNYAGSDGGGLSAYSGDVALYTTRFIGNTAVADGGGALLATQSKLYDVEFSGNAAGGNGGGAVARGTTLIFTSGTVVGNRAGALGGGLRLENSTATIQDSFAWLNQDSSGVNTASSSLSNDGTVPLVRYAMVSGCKPGGVWNQSLCGMDGGVLPDKNPLLLAPTSPGLAPTSGGDNRLSAASPLRNKGDNAVIPLNLTQDLAGLPRVMGGVVDIGAYEEQTP